MRDALTLGLRPATLPLVERIGAQFRHQFNGRIVSNGTEPGARYRRLIEPIWGKISIYDGPEIFLRHFRRVQPGLGHLFAATWCQSEVRNGGFHQFFSNHTGVLAPEALAAYRAIGLSEWASLLEEAMRFFGVPYPREREVRQEHLAAVVSGDDREEWDPFDALDDRFYDWLHEQDNRWERVADSYASGIGV